MADLFPLGSSVQIYIIHFNALTQNAALTQLMLRIMYNDCYMYTYFNQFGKGEKIFGCSCVCTMGGFVFLLIRNEIYWRFIAQKFTNLMVVCKCINLTLTLLAPQLFIDHNIEIN